MTIDADTCTGCKKCITSIGCPGIGFDEGLRGPKSGTRGQAFVDTGLCDGCGLCTQVCPFDAIQGAVGFGGAAPVEPTIYAPNPDPFQTGPISGLTFSGEELECGGDASGRRGCPMIDILLAGVGGQGTVLAAKVLAQAAQSKGWQVRTAETIGMAQRGGNVTSHVRMGSNGEAVYSPLITPGTADVVIALEPGEAARALPFLAPGGVLVTATTAIQPVTAALSSTPYRAGDVVAALANSLQAEASREQAAEVAIAPNAKANTQDAEAPGVEGYPVPLFVPVDDEALVREAGASSRKSLNMMLLAVAVAQGRVPLTVDELKDAVRARVKPQFVAMNLAAIDTAVANFG